MCEGTQKNMFFQPEYKLITGDTKEKLQHIDSKKFDLIIDAFNKLGLPLKIVGEGVAKNSLMNRAEKNIEFLGYVSDEELKKLYQRSKALIFPQIEDFGIIPLEAMASGCPVIAYGKGGALETVVDGKTGMFFDHQTSLSLKKAIEKFEDKRFNHRAIRKHAEQFSEENFNSKLLEFIEKKWIIWQKEMHQ